ncbi:glycosyltransferase [uncultured Dokdonia sp.]|uniref:glycosyltransferase n=1 Tax=uncultured Dokdonia sp. TaxID=575653 RepID=UPI002633A3FD|nr:glycosyltransferase [uncultured Dokdonia sp.]
MKNILIISYIYPPYNAPAARRPYSWAKYLDKSKYKVTVLTCSNPDSSLGMDSSMDNVLPGVELIAVKSLLKSNIGTDLRSAKMDSTSTGLKTKIKKGIVKIGSYLLIPDKAIFWHKEAKKYLSENKDLIDVLDIVISTSPSMTNHLLGMHVKKMNPNVQLIGDLRDYHYIHGQELHSPWPLSLFHKRFENNILKKADTVTFISNAMRDIYAKHYQKDAEKFSVIYNGFDADDFNVETEVIARSSEKIRIFYAGSFYGGIRSPKGLLQLLDWAIEEGLMSLDDVEVVIAGNFEKSLQDEMASFKSYAVVDYIGKIPRNEVLKQYQQSTILWLIVGEKLSHYTGVPLKFYEYLAANKYIINFAPNASEPSALIDTYNLGSNFDIYNDSKEEQIDKLRMMMREWRNNQLQVASQDKVLAIFDRKNQTKLLEKLFV